MTIDLVCLVPDKHIEALLAGLLRHRSAALEIREVTAEISVHPRRDPGCYHEGTEFLRGLLGRGAAKGLLVLDQAWDGNPHPSAIATETSLRSKSPPEGPPMDVWVIEPEVGILVWSDSPHVDEILGWRGSSPSLRQWLGAEELWLAGEVKPRDPKAALEAALREKRIPHSSSLFRQIAARVGLRRCVDASFSRLRHLLQEWFPR